MQKDEKVMKVVEIGSKAFAIATVLPFFATIGLVAGSFQDLLSAKMLVNLGSIGIGVFVTKKITDEIGKCTQDYLAAKRLERLYSNDKD